MRIEVANRAAWPRFPYEGLVRWPLAGWLAFCLSYVLLSIGLNGEGLLTQFVSLLLVVAVCTLVFLAGFQLFFIPVGVVALVKSPGDEWKYKALSLVCGGCHFALAVFIMVSLTSELGIRPF